MRLKNLKYMTMLYCYFNKHKRISMILLENNNVKYVTGQARTYIEYQLVGPAKKHDYSCCVSSEWRVSAA